MNYIDLDSRQLASRVLDEIITQSGQNCPLNELDLSLCDYDIESAIINIANEIADLDTISEGDLKLFAINNPDYLDLVINNGYAPLGKHYYWQDHFQVALIHYLTNTWQNRALEITWEIALKLKFTDGFFESAQRKALKKWYYNTNFHSLAALKQILNATKEREMIKRY